MIDNRENGLFVRAPNITSGGASPARGYTDADWVRALRHGVKPSGEPLQIMPSEDYAQMIDADVAAIVAYVRSLPPVDGAAAQFNPWPLPFKALYVFGVVKDAAEKIDHAAAVPAAVPHEARARGRYVAQACTGCHGALHVSGAVQDNVPYGQATGRLSRQRSHAVQESRVHERRRAG